MYKLPVKTKVRGATADMKEIELEGRLLFSARPAVVTYIVSSSYTSMLIYVRRQRVVQVPLSTGIELN